MQLVIFTGQLDFNVRWNVVSLAERFADAYITILVHAPRKRIGKLCSNQLRNLKRHGWRWIPYQLAEIATIVAARGRRLPPHSPDRPGQMFSTEALASHPRITIQRFASINGADAIAFVRNAGADLGIALGAPILKEALFSLPRLGTINLHKGRLPDYRGMPPAFWELQQEEASVGCTVHKVEAGLDTGDIVLERSVAVDRFSTVPGIQVRLHRVGVELVCEAVQQIMDGTATFTRQLAGGSTNTRPTLATASVLTAKRAALEPGDTGTLKKAVKRAVFFGYASVLMPVVNYWHGLTGQQRLIILLYHRVSDEFRDSVTIGIERFDQHMAYISKHYTVVSLKQVVEGNIPRSSFKPVLAVSFDDGYLDNFENAAPILMKHQVPCTFFISTEKIRDNKPFDHDLRALGFGLNNMNWSQVQTMHRWGFQFGSHTRNHVNLAEISDELALQELQGSLNDIRTQLGQQEVFIAFPYGRKQHITKARIDMMKSLGYGACFSAYGGLNELHIDRFNIKRIGVNWAFDLPALQARTRGWDKTQ
jgi:peptidoglycan/xylan/chitin deacetylase (PgdA/CDA1 family)